MKNSPDLPIGNQDSEIVISAIKISLDGVNMYGNRPVIWLACR
jgi:hypothetical protein